MESRFTLKPVHKSLREALVNEESFATTLIAILIDRYETEFLGWLPDTVRMEVEEDFKIDLPAICLDRIMAGISILTQDDFFNRLSRFVAIANVLSGSPFTTRFDPATAEECAWAITEALLLFPPEGEHVFADDIRYYIGAILMSEGIRTPPDILRIALFPTRSGEADYSDLSTEDPIMFGAEFQAQQDKAEGIKQTVQENLQRMFQQLEELDLRNGNTKGLLCQHAST